MPRMKITRSTPNGCICGECGKHCGVNEGCSVAYLNGNVHFGCPYCGKTTVMDMTIIQDEKGNAIPYKSQRKKSSRRK